MNEYHQRNWEIHSADAERVVELVNELNKIDSEDWEVVPLADPDGHAPMRHHIRTKSGLLIVCNHNGYGLENRWRFGAGGWPSYVDQDGHTVRIDASRLYSPREAQPVTTAADNREFKAIAKQILTKLVTPYRPIYSRCARLCIEYGEKANNEKDALERVQAACGTDERYDGRRGKLMYANPEAKDSVRVEFCSASSVKLDMTAAQAVKVLEVLA